MNRATKRIISEAAEKEANALVDDGWYTEDYYMAVCPREVSCEGDDAKELFFCLVKRYMAEARFDCENP